MSAELREHGEVTQEGVTLRGDGLKGQVRVLVPGRSHVRSETISVGEVDRSLDQEGVTTSRVIELTDTRVLKKPTGARRGAASDAAHLIVEVPAPTDGYEQMLLSRDEAGVYSWHFTQDLTTRNQEARGGPTRTYRVPINGVGGTPAPTSSRGILGTLGKKLFKVLIFPIARKVIGSAGKFLTHEFEKRKRPYRVRSMTPDDYGEPTGSPPDWDAIASGPALLLVHGTNMLSHLEFGRMPRDGFTALYEAYGGRVLALDHHTLSETPQQNLDYFLSQVPDGIQLKLDALTVSRGGLVARQLAERQTDLDLGRRRISMRNIVFVATPNAGTLLADAEHWQTFIDRYTNLLTLIPDNPVTDVMDGIVTAAKIIALGALDGMPGLGAMVPGGPYLKRLNQGARDSKRYFAIAANFEPNAEGLMTWARDLSIDAVFEGQENDLIVPTAGVFSDVGNASGFFPIVEPLIYRSDRGVDHSGYFRHEETLDALHRWLVDN